MYNVTEGGTAGLTVVLNMAYTDEITVALQTSPGSATGNWYYYNVDVELIITF